MIIIFVKIFITQLTSLSNCYSGNAHLNFVFVGFPSQLFVRVPGCQGCQGARVGMQQKRPPCQSNSSHPSPLPHLKCISNASQIHLKYVHTSNTEIFLIRILIFLTLCTIRSVDKFGIVEKQLTRTLSAVTWLRHKMSNKL